MRNQSESLISPTAMPPDDERRGLRPRVAAGRDEERDVVARPLDGLEDGVVVAQRRLREELLDEEDDEPHAALPDELEEAGPEVGQIEWLDAADLLQVLGLLLRQDVDDVVDGDDAEQGPSRVDHRHRVEVVLRHLAGDLFLVLLGRDGEDVGAHDVGEDVAGIGDDAARAAWRARGAVVLVDRVDGVDGLARAPWRARVRRPAPPPPCTRGETATYSVVIRWPALVSGHFSMSRTSSAASGSTLSRVSRSLSPTASGRTLKRSARSSLAISLAMWATDSGAICSTRSSCS